MKKLLFASLFIGILVLSLIPSSLEMDIPPTNAFQKIHTSNDTVSAINYSMPFTVEGINGITVTGNNNSHKVIINGTTCSGITVSDQTANRDFNTVYKNTSGKSLLVSIWVRSTVLTTGDVARGDLDYDSVNPPTSGIAIGFGLVTLTATDMRSDFPVNAVIPNNWFYELLNNTSGSGSDTIIEWTETQDPSCGSGLSAFSGTYNQTQANGVTINTNGNRINFINGTNNPVHVVNSPNHNQVNITISSTGSGSGVTELNGFTGMVNLTRGTVTNMSSIINSSGKISYQMKPNVVLTNGSKQTFSKDLDFGQAVKDVFANAGMYIRNTLSTFTYNIIGGAITQNVTLSLPITNNSADTIAVLKTPQTFTAPITFTPNGTRAGINIGSGTADPSNIKIGDMWLNSNSNQGILKVRGTGGTNFMVDIGTSQTFTGAKIFANNQTISTGQNLYMGTANITTTAVRGYLYLSTTDGTPTGTPASHTGGVPVTYDGKSNKLCIYNGGWKCVTLS